MLFVVAMLLGLLFVPQAPAAILSGSLSPTGGAVDLTTEGTQDWALWGYTASGTSTSLAPDVRKAGGSAISDLTDINPTAVPRRGLGQFTTLTPFTFDWSNGAPTAAAALAYAGLQHDGQPSRTTTLNGGFSFTVPADTTQRTVRVYVSAHSGTGTLTATLSDGSAPAFVDSGVTGPTNGANVPGVYTITYAAAEAGQTLTVQWIESVSTDFTYFADNVAIYAVALDGPATYTVNTSADGMRADLGCTVTDCTLREAIDAANAHAGGAPDTIAFAIPGSGPHVIVAGSNLPDITDGVVVDGTTQPGYAGTPVVEVRGPGGSSQAFFGAAEAVTIRALSITGWGTGVMLLGSGGVESSWFGVEPAGGLRANTLGVALEGTGASVTGSRIAGGLCGVLVTGTQTAACGAANSDAQAGSGNTIGGDESTGAGNRIYGFQSAGVFVSGAGTGNLVQGNVIGVDPEGTPNGASNGVYVNDSPGTVVGADAGPRDLFVLNPDLGNVVAGISGGEGDHGIFVGGSSAGTRIAANAVGTDRAGTATDLGITGPGVVVAGASGVQIGPGNRIAYNLAAGVDVADGSGNRIVANSIHDNGGLGIALSGGANNSDSVGPPTSVTAVVDGPGTATVAGTMNGAANRTYFVEIFVNTTCDPSGFGEGSAYVSFVSATTDGLGSATFSQSGLPAALGSIVTLTATDASTLDTTTFSQCATVAAAPTVPTLDSVGITALSSTVVAGGGRVPLADIPPSAFLTSGAVSRRAAPVNDVPINEILLRDSPVNDIPINEVGLPALAPQLGDVLLSTVPLLRPGGWEQALQSTALASRPLQNVTLRDVFELSPAPAFIATLALSDLDLSNSPLGRISAVAFALGQVTLSQLELQGTTWCEVLAGPPIDCAGGSVDETTTTLLSLGIQGAPINDIPVNDIPVNEVPINEIPVNDIPINEITVRGTPINDVPINDVPVNDIPVNDIPINDIPVNDIPINDVATRALPINEVPVNDIPVNDIPVNDVPVNEVPVNDIPVNDIPVNEVPVNDIPVNEILLAGSPVNDIPVNDIALPLLVFTIVPATGTVGQNAASLRPGVTLGELRLALQGGLPPDDLPDSVTLGTLTGGFGGTTIGDLIEALAAVTYAPGQNPPTLAQIVGLIKSYTGTAPPQPSFGDLFDLLLDIDAASSSVNLDLAALARLLYGSDATLADLLATVLTSGDLGWERLDLAGLGVSEFAENVADVTYEIATALSGGGTGTVTVSATLPDGFTYVAGSSQSSAPLQPFAPLADPAVSGQVLSWTVTGAAAPGLTLRFKARPGTRLGPADVTAEAVIDAEPAVAAPVAATVNVTETFPNAALPTPEPIAADAFYLSYVSSSADGDAYSLPAPPAGSRVTINLSHLPVDFDLVVYGPGGQVLVPVSSSAVPLDGQPLADGGSAPTHTIDAVPAQILGDVPIAEGRTVVGISANRTTQDDAVVFVSGGVGEYVVQVSGFNNATSIEPYMLRAEVLPPRELAACVPRTGTAAASATEAADPVPAGVNTVFVVNRRQLARIYGDASADATIASIRTRLASLAAAGYPSTILQVDAIAAVQASYDGAAGWNACPSDPVRANGVVIATGARVREFKAAHPTLQYVVIVGSDDVIPFARLDDRTTLSNEDAFAGSFDPSSPLGGALAGSKLLSDDPYGTLAPVPFFDRQLYVPELAVGRLVETPAQIQAQLAAFAARVPSGAVAGATALTTGYDFLTDGAQSVTGALAPLAPGGANATLISDTWGAADLGAALAADGGQPPAFVSINAHADDSRFQAANGTLYTTDDVLAAALTFDGRVVFSMGCHAGLNVPNAFLPPGRRADWAERLIGAGAAIVIANTGFGYGDSDVVAYSEDLNARFAANLADGMTAGEALTLAKQEFQGDLGIVGVYDEKAMAELTLYGLPMVAVAGAAPQALSAGGLQALAAAASSIGAQTLAAAALVTTTTDPFTGLQAAPFTVSDPGLTGRAQSSTTARGTYYEGRDGEIVAHLRPIEPKATESIVAPNAHGALITGLTSEDIQPFDPLFARPTVDSSASEPEIAFDEAAFPAKLQTVTSVKTFTGRRQKLVLAQGQFFSSDPVDGSEAGFQRLFTSIEGHVLVSPSSDYAEPLFRSVNALKTDGTTVTFTTEVDAGDGDTVERVLVLYLGGSGTWTPLDLELVGGRWSGSASIAAPDVQYFVQAVDASGNVAVSTNKGFYYAGTAAPPPTGAVTIATAGPLAANGTFTGAVDVTADAPDGVAVLLSVDGAAPAAPPLQVTGNGVHTVVAQGSNGDTATTSFVIDTAPPSVTITAGPAAGSATTSTGATFELEASEPGSSFECALDDASFSSCTSATQYTGLAEGRHAFRVRATDVAGNTGAQQTRIWFVDGTPPVVTIDSGPAASSLTRKTSAVLSFSADETVSFECRLDTGSFAGCDSPQALTGLADGPHTFTVRATDLAGNTSAEAARTWTVDTGAPVVTITAGPADGSVLATRSGSFAFSVVDSSAVTVACTLDAGTTSPCTSPFAFASLADGVHTFRVTATDVAGNIGLSERSWTIDAVGPTITITSPVNGTSFAVGASATAQFSCTDGPAPAPSCTATVTGPAGTAPIASGAALPTGLVGSYTLTVTSVDQAGTTTTASSAYAVTLQGQVAFVRANRIWVIPAAGGTARQLTQTPADVPGNWVDEEPAISPDGKQVVFARRTAGPGNSRFQLWTIGGAGANAAALNPSNGNDTAPAWSRDGTKIAFQSTRGSSRGVDVWSINANGTGAVNLTNRIGSDESPTWSHNGAQIAFASNRQLQFNIYRMNANGSSPTRLTSDLRPDVEPAWSPAPGAYIAFARALLGPLGYHETFVMTSSGSGQTRISTILGVDRQPHWLDANRVVFARQSVVSPGGLFIVQRTGGPPAKIAGTQAGDRQPG